KLEAWIEVDGVRLEEHKVEYNRGTQTICCWIASESDKEFDIVWICSDDAIIATRGRITIDGYRLGGQFGPGERVYSAFRMDDSQVSPLRFGKMELIDDESAVANEAFLKNVGVIQLVVQRGSTTPSTNPMDTSLKGQTNPCIEFLKKPTPIYENLKKTGGHRLVLGEPRKCEKLRERIKFTPRENDIPVKFMFNYRPKVIDDSNLVKRQILTESTSAPSVKEDEEEATLRAVQKSLAALEERLKLHISQRQNPFAGSGNVKKEHEPMQHFFAKGEVIDLTED
ncbi:hypothetical protein CALCODRAFT_544832, partial [Calocera cornea HHB12733]